MNLFEDIYAGHDLFGSDKGGPKNLFADTLGTGEQVVEEDEGVSLGQRVLGGLVTAGDIISRPFYAGANIIEGVVEGKPGKGFIEAGKAMVPFGETFGLDIDRPDFDRIMRKAGVPKGPTFRLPILGDVSTRGTAGFIADVVLDPLNLIPGGAILRSTGRAGKGVKEFTRKGVGRIPKPIRAATRGVYETGTVRWLRGLFTPALDPKLAGALKRAAAEEVTVGRSLEKKNLAFARELIKDRGIDPKFLPIIPKLSEFTPDLRTKILNNPESVPELTKSMNELMDGFEKAVPDVATRDAIESAAVELRRRKREILEAEQKAGLGTQELGSALDDKVDEAADKVLRLTEELKKTRKQIDREFVSRIAAAEKGYDRLTRILRMTGSKADSILDDATQAEIDGTLNHLLAAAKAGIVDTDIGKFGPGDVRHIRDLMARPPKTAVALKKLIENFPGKLAQARLVKNVRAQLARRKGRADKKGVARISAMEDVVTELKEAREFLPAYTLHAFTPDAVDELVRRKKGRKISGFASKLHSPKHASMIQRVFTGRGGRPMTLVEVEDIMRKVDEGKPVTIMDKAKEFFGMPPKGSETFELDPALLLHIRTQRYAKAKSGKQFLDEAKELFGKTGDDVIEEKLAKARAREDMSEARFAVREKVMREQYTDQWVADRVSDGWFSVDQPYLRGVVFDNPEVAAEIDKVYTNFINDKSTNELVKVYDSVLSWFKVNVLFTAPAYFTRNLIGGMWQTWNMSGNPLSMAKSYQDAFAVLSHKPGTKIKIGQKSYTAEEIVNTWSKHGAMTQSQFALESPRKVAAELEQLYRTEGAGLPRATDRLRGGIAEAIRPAEEVGIPARARGAAAEALERGSLNITGFSPTRLMEGKNPFAVHNAMIRSGQAFAQWVDDVNRLATGFEALRQGDTLVQAADQILKFQFDFSAHSFSWFENNIMRRVIPFYAWQRRSVPAQLWAALHVPSRFRMPARITGAMSEGDVDESVLPDYMIERAPIRVVDDADGTPRYIWGMGLPAEDLNILKLRGLEPDMMRTLEGLVGMTSPLLKLIWEPLAGKNFFFGEDIEKINRAPAGLRYMPKMVKNFMNFKEFDTPSGIKRYTMNPIYLNVFSNNPSGFQRMVFGLSKLLDPRAPISARLGNFLTGGRISRVEPERYLEQRRIDAATEKMRELARKGEPVKFYESASIPKWQEGGASQKTLKAMADLKALLKMRKARIGREKEQTQ